MITLHALLGVTMLLQSEKSAEAQRSRGADAAIARVAEQFQQSLYEFGLHLALDEGPEAKEHMLKTWRLLTQLRNRACPADLRKAVTVALQGSGISKQAEKQLDAIEAALGKLAESQGTDEARKHLAAAREALKSRDKSAYRASCAAIMDSIVAEAVGLPIDDWSVRLQRAQQILSGKPNERKLEEARVVLREMKGIETFRQQAYVDSLTTADELIAAATDLYAAFAYQEAAIQLQRAARALRLAGRASRRPEVDRQVSQMVQQLAQAERYITREDDELNNARFIGYQNLDRVRSEIGGLIERPVEGAEKQPR